jgi:hypothetical protein
VEANWSRTISSGRKVTKLRLLASSWVNSATSQRPFNTMLHLSKHLQPHHRLHFQQNHVTRTTKPRHQGYPSPDRPLRRNGPASASCHQRRLFTRTTPPFPFPSDRLDSTLHISAQPLRDLQHQPFRQRLSTISFHEERTRKTLRMHVIPLCCGPTTTSRRIHYTRQA